MACFKLIFLLKNIICFNLMNSVIPIVFGLDSVKLVFVELQEPIEEVKVAYKRIIG
tara:strand:- start:219 stop:386 length:168 start_codon:yes stop_codon:yes gene_type:complete